MPPKITTYFSATWYILSTHGEFMDNTSVIMKLMETLNRLGLLGVNDFEGYLILRMGIRWYVEEIDKEASTLAS
jgi:hypothetical protein